MTTDDGAPTGEGDEAWLAALAGRERRDASGSTAIAEAAMLRWSPPVEPVDARDPVRVARLIARARAVGLLPDTAGETASRGLLDRLRAAWHAGSAMGLRPAVAMTMLLAVVAGGTLLMRPPLDESGAPVVEVERGGDAVTLLRAADPQALRAEIVAALATQGIRATTYTRFGRYGLDADLPQPLPPASKAVLDRFHLPAPGNGVLRVEVEAARR